MFDVVEQVLKAEFPFGDKDKDRARSFFMDLQQTFIDWNDKKMDSPEFVTKRDELLAKLASAKA